MTRPLTATVRRLAGLASTARRIAGLPLELHAIPAYRWVHYFAMGEFFAKRRMHTRREEAASSITLIFLLGRRNSATRCVQ